MIMMMCNEVKRQVCEAPVMGGCAANRLVLAFGLISGAVARCQGRGALKQTHRPYCRKHAGNVIQWFLRLVKLRLLHDEP